MDTKKHMIIVDGKIKTREVKSCKYNKNTGKKDVIYYNSDKCYSYTFDNVVWLSDPQIINHNVYRFYRNGMFLIQSEKVQEAYLKSWHYLQFLKFMMNMKRAVKH